MRVVLQRVKHAQVTVDDVVVGRIETGLLVLVGIRDGDGQSQIDYFVDKLINLRVFEDDAGKMNRSLLDVGGSLLVVSQFTLYGDARKGRRPSYIDAARPEIALPIYERFVECLRATGITVATGQFAATMAVELLNDGPVTLVMDSP